MSASTILIAEHHPVVVDRGIAGALMRAYRLL